jgi:hypothetical protein
MRILFRAFILLLVFLVALTVIKFLFVKLFMLALTVGMVALIVFVLVSIFKKATT